jgi:hypothetical protein
MIWNTVPTTNGVAADAVLCQPDFTTDTAGISDIKASNARTVYIYKNEIYVMDDSRVLKFIG